MLFKILLIKFVILIFFCVIIYFYLYSSRQIQKTLPSFIAFSFNYFTIIIFIFSFFTVICNNKNPIYIEDLSWISAYKYSVFISK